MVVWKPNWKTPVQMSAKSRDFANWLPDTQTVQYSGEFGIQVSVIEMVTALDFLVFDYLLVLLSTV